MNGTVAGVLILIAAVAPGLLFVNQLRSYRVEGKRSDLEEAGTAVAVGGLTTLVSATMITSIALETGIVDSTKLGFFINDPVGWLGTNPEEIWFVSLLVIVCLALSGLIASGLPVALNWWQSRRDKPERALVAGDVWHRRLQAGTGKVTWCEILLEDGRAVAGFAKDWSLPKDPSHPRDLALEGPIYSRDDETSDWIKLAATYLILRSDSIKTIEVEILNN